MPDDTQLVIGGEAAHAFQTYAGAAADEYKLQVDSGEVTTQVVDPWNVMMVSVSVTPAVTGSHPENAAEWPTVGLPDSMLSAALSPARKGRGNDTGDDVRIGVDSDSKMLSVSVEREYDQHKAVYDTAYRWIDPNAIRQEPDLPDLELPVEARVDRQGFVEAVRYTTDGSDYVRISSEGGDVTMEGVDGQDDQTVTFTDIVDDPDSGETANTLLSADCLTDLTTAIRQTKPDWVRLQVGRDYPLKLKTELPNAGVEMEGMIAPRIQDDSD